MLNLSTPAHQQGFIETSRLLAEVLDYMLRLPAVPLTVELARKVRAHLDDPGHWLAVEQAKHEARRAALRHGANYTPAGVPVVEVEIDRDIARLWTPPEAAWKGREIPLLHRLRQVETVQLADGPALHFESTEQSLPRKTERPDDGA
ncbi:MAG: hypothetical protein H7Y19_14500 [Luteimonas sp.]|nr:hypothetical protein [Luteimonas sp.]